MPKKLGNEKRNLIKREISVEKRAQICILREQNFSLRKIAQIVKVSVGGVRRTLNRNIKTGKTCSRSRSGRPKVTTSRQDRFIVRQSLTNRLATAPKIAADFSETKPVSVKTIARRLKAAGLDGRVAVRKPLLRKQNIVKRLAWAKAHKNWSLEKWKKCLFSDESKYELFGSHRRQYVRRRQGERYLPECIVPTVKHGGGSVIVWGCFGNNKVGDLIKIEGIMDAKYYHKILSRHAVPSGTKLIEKGFVFQQDNDPKHTSKMCKKYLQNKEKFRALEVMIWPPQSPDLNPIELLWDELDREIRKKSITSKEILWQELQNAWKRLSATTLEKLISRMPRICLAVIKAKGRHFDEANI